MAAPEVQSTRSSSASTSKIQTAEKRDSFTSSNGYHESNGTNGYNGIGRSNGYGSSSPVLHSPTSSTTKTSILRERTIRMTQSMRVRFGGSSDMFLDNISSFEDFLDAVADQRLRFMPHSGSKWDKVLRWAEGFCTYVYGFHHIVHTFMLHSEDASRMIWNSVLALLEMGPRHIKVLTKVFSVLNRLGMSITLLLRQELLLTATSEIRRGLAHAYSDLMELTCAISMHYVGKSQGDQRIDMEDFNDQFNVYINAYYQHRDHVADALWSVHMKSISEAETDNFHDIRSFLEPADRSVQKLMMGRHSLGSERAEFTCEWFNYHLNDFVIRNNKMLLITGPSGCGKTMLSDWIVESLRGSMESDQYDVVFYRVWTDIPETTSALSLVKDLFMQTLNRNIGDEVLISSARRAMDMASNGSPAAAVEKVLWEGLAHVASHSKLMIVVDGLDQITGDQHAVLDHLHFVAAADRHSKVIVLSRPLQKPAPSKTQHLSISEKNILHDIQLLIESRMDENDRMSGMNITDKKEIAQKIAEKSHGSFLWADCAFQCLKHERTPSGFMQWLARAPKSIEHFVDHHVNELQLADAETRAILSWILAAHRPLAVTEIKQLLEIDTKNHTISVRYDDVTETIRHAVGPLVDIVEGHVCLKHPSFRPHLVEFQTDKFKFDVKKAQSSLTLRLLAYVKHYVHEDTDVAWRPARPYEARTYFDSHALLEYATRYWVDHFRVSRFYSTEQKTTEIDVRLRKCWPSSTLLAVLEGACFGWGTVSVERETNQRVAFEMRKAILGMHATATLQSMVFLIQHYTQTRRTEVTSLAYEAWQISRTISSSDTTVALECAHAFVMATDTLTVKKRTEVVTRKEEMLQYLIATHKRTGGVSHERTIRYTKTLAELYVSISETDRAVSLYRDLYNVSIERYGYFHEETTAVYNTLVQHLKATNRHDTVLEIVRDYHAYVCKTLSVNDERRVKSTMNLVSMYEERKEVAKAEEVLVSYWKSVMTSSKSSSTSIETKVDIAVEYSRFLRRHQRTEEAEAVMRGVYSEVVNTTEESRQESSSVFKRVKAIAQEFKSLKSFSMARSIYSRLWEQTKSSSSTESSSMSEEVATELAETVSEEITTKTETTTMSTSNFSTLTTEDESTLREVFQSSLTMSSSNKSMSSSVIKTGMALSSSYYKKEQYHEAATTYSQILSKTWASIETRESSVQEHSEEMIEVAMSLAECCFQQLQIERSETIYRNVFRTLLLRSSKNSSHHEWVVRKARAVIEYHKRIYRFDAAVTYYHDLCLHLHQRLGKAHSTTIEMFIEYGTLARKLGRRKDAVEAFRHIHLAFKHEEGCILRKGVEPSLTLCELYEQDHAWGEARSVYAALWLTVTTHAKDFDLREWVEVVYERYRFVLEKLSTGKKEEYEALRQVAVEYTATCKTLYGEKHERTVRATLQLAELCERSETHREEAIRLYEEALKQSSKTSMTTTRSNSSQSTSQTTSTTSRTTTTTTTVSSVARNKLAHIYSSKETSSSRAVSLHEEQLASTRAEYGASSSESLTATRELVRSYKRQNTSESTSKAVSTLRSSVLEIFKSERSSERVFEAARSLAQTYVAHGFKAEAASVSKELRASIFQQLRETKRSESSLAVFLAAFEETAVGRKSFSAAMADIRSEIFLYSAYFEALSSSTKTSTSMHITTILARGVRLRTFLLESERTEEAKRVEEELFAKFAEHMSVESTTTVVDKQTHRTTLEAFFSIFLSNMADTDEDSEESNSTQISITIIEHAVNTVREYANAARYANALALAALVQRYVALVGGFASGAVVHAVARLCLYLAGRGTEKNSCKQADAALYARCLDLSRALLRHALEACAALGISLTDMAVTELNEIVVVLGDEQRSYEVLEHVLAALWHDRTVHRTWSTQLVLAIGLRLTETRAAQGRVDDAIHLAEDIRYNLHRVYGPLDVATLQFTMLLSSLYTTRGRHSEAVQLHEHALTRLANGVGAKEDGEDGVSGSADESAKAALAQLEGAQRCIAAAGGWNGAGVDAGRFRELFGELSQKYGGQRAWGERKMAPVEKWSMKVDAKTGAGWKAPETFSLTAVGYDGAKEGGVGLFDGAVAGRAKRASALRKVSNHVVMHGSRSSSYGSQMSQLPVRAV
ncbi:Nacht domain protein [Lasiodiplodia theobromae]|uniref:Nacht domain protein n=1 Tax=Lasiodiplodia theobromae TaxID=45133 RepID=UPI0015C3AA02|nr:Nacht domain protein [Lasiodiplodia theobromae]KAF4538184.1 Nacht domain protein [Lasiodiplodia theobromae]